MDGAGNLFISEGNYADVRKVSADGTISTVLAPNTALPYFGVITAVTVDRTGNLFVGGFLCDSGDNCNDAIRRISPSGSVTLIAGGSNSYPLQAGGSIGDGEGRPFRRKLDSSPASRLMPEEIFCRRPRWLPYPKDRSERDHQHRGRGRYVPGLLRRRWAGSECECQLSVRSDHRCRRECLPFRLQSGSACFAPVHPLSLSFTFGGAKKASTIIGRRDEK